ncbi:MAG: type VI secretion system baseplate subunit TssE [Burkholderiales bacterium]|nr:type VI secretion system baseplate subunit TssE [Burkholderiales bacterium]
MENRTLQRSEADRLQPALLDRLTDDEPEKRKETAEHAVVSKQRLKRTVLRDLAWLLNTTAYDVAGELEAHPEVRKSVINYGIPVLSGKHFSDIEWGDIESAIRESILAFEPRILPDSLVVQAVTTTDSMNHHNKLQFEIRGELWSLPFPIELFVRTEWDLETRQISIADQLSTGTN